MSIYKRGNNYYVDFFFKGVRVRESIGPSKKDAEKVIAKRKTEIIENKYLDIRKDPDPISFHDFAKEYVAWAKVNKKPSSFVRDLSIMRTLQKEFEGKNIQDITTWQIEKFKEKRRKKLKPASVNREMAILKHYFSKAIEWDRLRENPVRGVKFLKGEVKRVRFLMPGEVQTLLSNCQDFLKPIVTVAVHTGMRRGELLGLKWDQVNPEQRLISILDSKNHERRDIPMDETVREILLSIARCSDFVFTSKGEPIHRNHLQRSFWEAVRASKIEDFRFHDLRHTFASNLVMAGVKIEKVQKLMGHKMLTMTQRYSHLAPGYLAEAVNVLDRVMSQISPQAKRVVNLRVEKE